MALESALINIEFSQFKALFKPLVDAGIGDDLFILDVKDVDELHMLRYPVRVQGFLAVYCEKGDISVEINMNEFRVSDHALLFSAPSNILRVSEVRGNLKDQHFIVVAASEDFMTGLNINFNRLVAEGLPLLSNPCIYLEGRDLDLAARYFDLGVEFSRQSNLSNKKEAALALVSSMFYLFEGIWKEKIKENVSGTASRSSRAQIVFGEFMQLVTEHHCRERRVSFYSNLLCLTPKYLSKLVKQVSGRSAPEWIDGFVILEAKNLLKYSDLNIKEIVYNLNFPNQSVFYKFFKAHAGMTPSEYRNS